MFYNFPRFRVGKTFYPSWLGLWDCFVTIYWFTFSGPPPQVKSADSFVPKRPPPSYAEVEGIWEDVPSAVSSDSIMFGPDPLYLICPICRIIVMTQVERERSAITHWIALILCLFLCWPCCLLPYYMKSCSYTYHSCPNCGHYFGMYNPFWKNERIL